MDEPVRMTFTMYRNSWDSPPLFQEAIPGMVYTEFEEVYEGRWDGEQPSLVRPMRTVLVDKRGTGRRFELVDVTTQDEFLRGGGEAIGLLLLVHPTKGLVYRLKEL